MHYPIRKLLRLVIEATTPFRIGTGESGYFGDASVLTDSNGLPYIPGSSLKGVLRTALVSSGISPDTLLGHQSSQTQEGAKVRISHAILLDENARPILGLRTQRSGYLASLCEGSIPLREHVRLNDKGTAANQGKFDESVVPRGARFVCELEVFDTEAEIHDTDWKKLIEQFAKTTFRIGSGSRRGFGGFKIISSTHNRFDLRLPEERTRYANHIPYAPLSEQYPISTSEIDTCIRIELRPENFWLFSQGYGDKDIDIVPARETTIVWESDTPRLQESFFIPAAGIKGGLSHRLAYHYNRITHTQLTAEKNPAVARLFGTAKNEEGFSSPGKILFEDIFLDIPPHLMTAQHVSIDRFTHKVIDGALFDEKAVDEQPQIVLNLCIDSDAFTDDPDIQKAWDCTLYDLKHSLLPLGSLTGRGYGAMKGTIK